MQAVKLVSTLDMPREEWLRQRKNIIGGSDAPAIVGMNPYKSAFEVWLDKTDPDHIEDKGNEAMRQGTDFEDYVARRFMECTGKKVKRRNFIDRHKDYPFMGANIDRWVIGENAGLECKTTSVYNKSDFSNGEYPDYYYVQCVHYMAVTGADRWYLAVLVLSKDFHVFTIERDEGDVTSLINAEFDFWNRYVLGGETPPPDGSESARDAIRRMFPNAEKTQTLLHGNEAKIKEYMENKAIIGHLKRANDRIAHELQLKMGHAELGIADGYKVSWPQIAGRTSLDIDALLEDYPELDLSDYRKTDKPTRRFTISEIKEDK